MTATARPLALEVNPDGIPAALKARDQWICWDYDWRNDKWTKVPICVATGALAESDNPATWGTFAAALRAYRGRGYAGVGYMFSADDPYCGIDIDKCMTAGADSPPLSIAVRTILNELDSYTEETPSGTGLHVIIEAALPEGRGRKNTKHRIEMYDRGRFFTVTGQSFPLSPDTPQPRQAELDDLYARLFPVRVVEEPRPARPQGTPPADDQALIDRAHRARNAGNFARLWRGDTSGHNDDDSSADLALCNHLAFWCGPDPARIDRLFRQSRLFRTKWERASYREPTIAKALAGRTEFYGWGERNEADTATFAIDGEEGDADSETGAPSTNPNDYAQTDTGNARLYAALYGGELRYDHRRAFWLRWAVHWWELDDDGHAMRLTEQVATLRLRAAAEIPDKDEQKHARRWALLSQGRGRREACLSIATTTKPLAVAGATWDRDPFLLGAGNGVIDLTTGALHPGAPGDEITLHSPVIYDPDARAPRWERFLREIFREDADLIRWVQRFAGYSLTGDISEHALVLCFGTGSNGKSTFLNALAAIMGDYAYTTPFSVLERSDRDNAATNDLAALVGRRLVTASETNEGRQFNEARIKALTGGDPITARFLHKEFFTFRPVLKLWLAVNHKPVVRDDSRGFWRRFRMLPFLASFDGEQADKHLDRTLATEAPGILAWAVRGCLDWRAHGLETPAIVTEATAEYERESDPIGPFIKQVCAEHDQFVIRATEFYQAYTEWAGEQGLQGREVLTRTLFGRRMGDRFKKTEDRMGTLYRGVALSDDWRERKGGARFAP